MNEETFTRELAVYNTRLRDYEEQMVQLQDEVERLRHESIHDPDTTLFSNAYFHSRLQEEIIRSERYRHFLSLILVHVETTNHYSTQQINRELRKIGLELAAGLARRTDIVALYRKRQMVIMLPETDPRGAGTLVQRYQAMFPNNGRRMSYMGLTYPNDASNIELVLTRLQEMSENLFRGTNTGTFN
jgi:two-component system cell cycle response regulator